jgi:hypothetical protein
MGIKMIGSVWRAIVRRRNRRQIKTQIQWGIDYIRRVYGPA